MTREQAINYLYSSGFSEEQVKTIVKAFEPTTKKNLGVDCISRVDAIKAMQDKAKKSTNEDTINGLCGAVAILFDLPSVTLQEPRWIPVKERLPQLKEQVLCCEKDKVFIGRMVFEHDGVPVFSTLRCDYYYVTAWMPLPKPYEPQESEGT